eukprot:CAMPEP_0119351110 /NCGR_PEP_ID=MMETSP1334-20130426/390_1 /TAXON_ID=127549 /ORGANISM="Calcidiscus leptoporus, Strain RCC1130" /LENGTH=110 /DNA_ID=CAMNT_0007363831 /DNA_START=124 /DNA_END=456 /DNA_ORIENTATION=-
MRRQPSRGSLPGGWLLAQHCAAMPILILSAGHSARFSEELTASSPGHRQKSGSLLLELPCKMATPAAGMGTSGGKLGGEDGSGSGGDTLGGEGGGGSNGDGGGEGQGSPE